MGCLAAGVVVSVVALYLVGRVFGTDVEIVAAIVLTTLSLLVGILRRIP